MQSPQDEMPPPYIPPGHEALALSWRHPKALFNLSVTTFILRIMTLGIYYFWAKTEVRKRLWSSIRINDEPLTYTGRGLELFLGFIIVFLVVLLPASLGLFGLMFIFGPESQAANFGLLVLYVAIFFLYGIAIYRAIRYRLARTRWRGIRGSLEGSPVSYATTYFWTLLLVPMTLGWIVPWRTTKLQGILVNNMRFGDRPLGFNALSGPLYGPFAALWFGTLVLYLGIIGILGATFANKSGLVKMPNGFYMPTTTSIAIIVVSIFVALFLFAAIGAWYRARTINHFTNHTHFEAATFRANLTTGGLIWLGFTNFLILLSGAILVAGLVSAVALPFVGLDFADVMAMQSRAAKQVVPGLAIFITVVAFSLFAPIVQARTLRYTVQHMALDGTAPLSEIEQVAGADVRYGEGLAEAFDVDAF